MNPDTIGYVRTENIRIRVDGALAILFLSEACLLDARFSRPTLKCTYHLQRTLFKPFATLFVCVVCMLAPLLGTDTSRALFC